MMELVPCNNAIIRLFIIFLLSFCLEVNSACRKNEKAITDQHLTRPEVTALQGTVRGVTMSTLNKRTIFAFRGIPYAEPPIGDLRFKAPVPASDWDETLDAGSDSPDCPQMLNGAVLGNEDCLYLNVYTPQLPTNGHRKLLPVMTYIHGGGFMQDSNNSTIYGPGYILDKDVILVVPSYRLGPLGFLSTGDAASPGNWGLKDQILALKWINKNIEFFGGDPRQVTIFGQSAGSWSVKYLALTDLTTGLFQRYITQSGSVLSTMAYQPTATSVEQAFRLGEYLGCPTDTSDLLIECLRATDVTKILDTTSLFIEFGAYPLITWLPTSEPAYLEGAVLTDSPANLEAAGKLRDLPHMVGSVPQDGLVISGYLYSDPDVFEVFLADFDNLLPYVLNYKNKTKNVSAYTSDLKAYYFNNDLTTDRTTLLSKLTKLCSDALANGMNVLELQQASANNPQYLYSFEYRGTYSYSHMWTLGLMDDLGVTHCDELIYLFPLSQTLFGELNRTMSKTDLEMVETIVELWTSFATTGEPKSTAMASNKSWPPYSKQMNQLRIGKGADVSLQVEESDYEDVTYFLKNLNANYM